MVTTAPPLMPMVDITNQLGGFNIVLDSVATNPLVSALKLTSVGHACTRFKREFLNYENCETKPDDQGQ